MKQTQHNFKKVVASLLVLLYVVILLPSNSLAAEGKQYKVGETYFGFVLKEEKPMEQLKSTAMVFEHAKTGAQLLYLKNDDDNKVFTIGFRTPVGNSTGIPHIIEHSVLCGSDKYPVKDPFNTMLKQSLYTFLNAETAIDNTKYPVASRNEKDFFNLMSVYLDAVFAPNFLHNKFIFMQEGWHNELDSKDAPLKRNGIIFNEMKGNFSDPQRILMYAMLESLYPDTNYKYVSGGNPEVMPQLTYEQFVEFYKKYYSPTNSLIYLYGDLNLDKALEYIDSEYLSKFDKGNAATYIEQKPFTERQVKVAEYPIAKDAPTQDKTYLSLNYVIGKGYDVEKLTAFYILDELLFNTDASPLRNALMDAKLGRDAYSFYYDTLYQPYYGMVVSNTNEDAKDKFVQVVNDTLNKIVKEGFDQKLIDAVFNSYELYNRQAHSSAERGLNYRYSATYGWAYANDPTIMLEDAKIIEKLKKEAKNGYFEKLIQECFLNNTFSSLVILKPVPGLDEKKAEENAKKLEEYKASLSSDEINKIVEETKAFKEWQNTPDSKEDLAKVPSLSREDFNKEPQITPTVMKGVSVGGLINHPMVGDYIKILQHPIYTNNISYSRMYFDAKKVPQDKVLYLHLLSKLLGRLATDKYTSEELSKEMTNIFGNFSISTSAMLGVKDLSYVPKTSVYISALDENLPQAFELLNEILNKTKFDNKDDLLSIIKETRAGFENRITTNAHNLARYRLNSYLFDGGQYNELMNFPFYNFICDLDKNFDTNSDEIIKNLKEVSSIIFNRNDLVVSITGDENKYNNFESNFAKFAEKLNSKVYPVQNYKFDYSVKNEGIVIPSKVQYVNQGYNYKLLEYKYSGKLRVLQNIVDNDFMWPEIRVKGGAYGGYFYVSTSGLIDLWSYRDPKLKETLETYKNLVDFLKNFKADEQEMINNIAGAIGYIDYLMNPTDRGAAADANYFTGVTADDLRREYTEILTTTPEDIANFAEMVQKILEQNMYVIFGGQQKINENKELFDTIMNGLNN